MRRDRGSPVAQGSSRKRILMPVTVIVGCQWGDEGKGKVVDQLSRRVDWVARFSGGHNAGHTVRFGKEQVVLHLIPCGILQKRPRCVIGHGS